LNVKKVYTTTLIICLVLTAYAQEPTFEWAIGMEGSNFERGQSITTDTNGNVYTTGSPR